MAEAIGAGFIAGLILTLFVQFVAVILAGTRDDGKGVTEL